VIRSTDSSAARCSNSTRQGARQVPM